MNFKFLKLRSAVLLLLSGFALSTPEIFAQFSSKCQEVTIPLVPNTDVRKEVPNTLVKSYQNYIITGHTDLDAIDNYYPVIHVRDREGNYYLSNMVKVLQAEIEELGGGGAYLMDMSEVTGNETVFLLGFVTFDNPGDLPACRPFLIEMEIFSGAIVQQTILDWEHSLLPYRMEVNEDHDQIVVVGEMFNDWGFTPIGLAFAPIAPQGKAFAINVSRSANIQTNWSLLGTLTINGTAELNIGSKFGGVKSTPSGYMIVGEMTTANPFPTSMIYPYATRLECAHIDFSGSIIWQKSIKLTNNKTRGVNSYYSGKHDKIYVLFQDYVSHTYGLVAMDPNSGTHGPLTLTALPGETNTSDLVVPKNDDIENLAVGGLLSNQDPLNPSTFIPFYHGYQYNPITQLFDVSSLHGMWGVVAYNGIDYSSNKLSDYFNWQNHSYSVFTRDNADIPNSSQIFAHSTFLYSVKNSAMNSLLFKKINYISNCGDVCATRLLGGTSNLNIPDSPTMQIVEAVFIPTDATVEPDHFDLDPQLTCGEYDDHYSPRYYYDNQDNNIDKPGAALSADASVRIFDILGKEIYKGKYSDFLGNRKKYTAELDGQLLIILDTKTGKTQKMTILNH